jgi:hypothetical protein
VRGGAIASKPRTAESRSIWPCQSVFPSIGFVQQGFISQRFAGISAAHTTALVSQSVGLPPLGLPCLRSTEPAAAGTPAPPQLVPSVCFGTVKHGILRTFNRPLSVAQCCLILLCH